MRIMLLLTTIPMRIITPMSTLAFIRELLVNSNASREPMAANGMANINTIGAVRDSNTDARII